MHVQAALQRCILAYIERQWRRPLWLADKGEESAELLAHLYIYQAIRPALACMAVMRSL